MDEVELKHYGIKGMRWGIRRKNPSGSGGTPKEKYTGLRGKSSDGASSKPKKSSVESLSDEELKKKVNRLNLEQQYTSLTNKKNARNQSTLKKGAKEVGDILADSGKNVATQIATKQMLSIATTATAATAVAIAKKKKG